jgi:hypothetical protein
VNKKNYKYFLDFVSVFPDVLHMIIPLRVDPFLGYGRETGSRITAVAREQILNKQQLNYNNRELLQKAFYALCLQSGYIKWMPFEAGLNTSTVALQFARGEEEGTQCLGV